MRYIISRLTSACLLAALVAFAASGAASADPTTPVNPLQKRFMQGKSLDICDQGSLPVVNGDYRAAAIRATNYTAVAAINASPTHAAKAEVIDLDDPKFGGQYDGTTHMNMLGTNNLQIFDVMLNWANDNIPNPIVDQACPGGNGVGKAMVTVRNNVFDGTPSGA
jgi:hypothetical protein